MSEKKKDTQNLTEKMFVKNLAFNYLSSTLVLDLDLDQCWSRYPNLAPALTSHLEPGLTQLEKFSEFCLKLNGTIFRVLVQHLRA